MSENGSSRPFLYRQVSLAVCSSLGFLSVGLIRGFSSPGIPSMELNDPHIVADREAISWIASIPPLGAFIGSLVAAPWMHWCGRKRVLQVIGPIFALSWCGIGYSNSLPTVAFFRACTGFGAGVVMPAIQVYVSECSFPSVRGVMASVPSMLMVFGIVIQYSLGFLIDWRIMAWVSAICPAALTLLLIPFPDSPAWLKLKGNDSYKEAYSWYGLSIPEEQVELTPLQGDHVKKNAFFKKQVMVPFSLALAIQIFQQTCANDIVTFNAVLIFRASGSSVDDFIASLIVGVVHFVVVVLSAFFVDKYGRKILLLGSSFVMGMAMAALGTYFFLHKLKQADGLTLLPLISLIVYIAAFSIGFCTVPLILVGEIIPLAQRSILGPIATAVGLGSMFLELKTYSYLVSWIREDGAFWVYSAMNFGAFIFILILLPETKGKSLEEIENDFRAKAKDKNVKLISSNSNSITR